MMKTGAGLAKWCEDIFAGKKHVYWYGTYCNPCSASLLKGKTRQYPEHYQEKRQATYKKHISQGKTCTDCVGLIKGYYWELDGAVKYRRDNLPDKGATGMYNAAKVKGLIANGLPEIPGILVWTKTKGHVGVYVGGGYVVEARGFSYGVQRNHLDRRAFVHWGLCPYIEYAPDEETLAIETAGETGTNAARASLRFGDVGEDVRKAQKMLMAAGTAMPKHGADGQFGVETLNAVKAYQTANGLKADGIIGPLTMAKLTGSAGSVTGATGTEAQKPVSVKRRTLRKGSKGPDVKAMQELLIKAGASLPLHGADGDYGAETVAAVKAYQVTHGLTPDGICGPLTWAKLEG